MLNEEHEYTMNETEKVENTQEKTTQEEVKENPQEKITQKKHFRK